MRYARSTVRSPAVGCKIPASTFSSVDLPDPLAPISPTVWPGAIDRSMSRSAQNSSLGTIPAAHEAAP